MSGLGEERLGILGGSFDPVHLGHLIAAQDALEHMQLNRVVFVPAAQAPLKGAAHQLEARQRLSLLEAAVGDDPRFSISTIELQRGGMSYSVDTAEAMAAAHPGAQLFWIIGADQASRLKDWRRIQDLGALVEFIVLTRPGYDLAADAVPPSIRLHPVAIHAFDVSSTEIRARIAAGKPVDWFLPAPVAHLIKQDHLYR